MLVSRQRSISESSKHNDLSDGVVSLPLDYLWLGLNA